ncbi:50S ribosome-binding GTPase [Candidatus Woesearchaeota archaeon]|nr:50S ribosome-binding GTPase [Candidatus Woesearchaeota archaeon]
MKQIQNKEQVKIVIVGHMDHGKSTLIGRLLYDTNSLPQGKIEEIIRVSKELGRELEFAYLIDNLEEEREQQLTMDTAQTFFKTKNRNYVIIDAPGHKEFIKNMITGASQADAAVLLLDAKEGIKEQTRRHAYILKLLDIKNLIVAVNKMDLIDYNELKFNKIKQEILGSLSKIGLNPDFIIPISALKGENILNKSTLI